MEHAAHTDELPECLDVDVVGEFGRLQVEFHDLGARPPDELEKLPGGVGRAGDEPQAGIFLQRRVVVARRDDDGLDAARGEPVKEQFDAALHAPVS